MRVIYPTSDDVADAVADRVAEAVERRHPLTIGLAGGSTPAAAYRRLGRRPIDWDRTTLWLGDERWVASDHPDANGRMARLTLGDAAAARLIVPDYDLGDPLRAAATYEEALRAACNHADEEGRPTLALLGIGDDGHTASLFPETDALAVTDRAYVANWVAAKGVWRLTATFPLLRSVRELLFVVTGEAKAGVVARILDNDEPLPAQRVAAGNPNATWLLDEAAASELRKTPR